MRGTIVRYFKDRGFGFIRSDGGKEYFFHVTYVVNSNEIEDGARVEFEAETGSKGENAKLVRIIRATQFLIVGNERIKISNIKHYGIKSETVDTGNLFVLGALALGAKPRKYLYITTHQGDNYTFSERRIGIDKVMAELDNNLAGK